MEKNAKIYVAGHTGMVGSAIVRLLLAKGYNNIITRKSCEVDLINQQETADFFAETRPDYVFLAAAKVGGILANNTYKGAFIYNNLMIQNNKIHQAYLNKVKKLLFLGSSCIYPKLAPQPLEESYLLTGPLEPTNEPYAIAKIAGIKLCDAYRAQYACNFISAMPTNLYGPNDNYDLKNSHVLPALMQKFHDAKVNNLSTVTIWGTGKPQREFMHVDDLADAALFLMDYYNEPGCINVGMGKDISILDLAILIKEIVGFSGEIIHDLSKPDGMMKKLLNVSKMTELGWTATTELAEGIKMVYEHRFSNSFPEAKHLEVPF